MFWVGIGGIVFFLVFIVIGVSIVKCDMFLKNCNGILVNVIDLNYMFMVMMNLIFIIVLIIIMDILVLLEDFLLDFKIF